MLPNFSTRSYFQILWPFLLPLLWSISKCFAYFLKCHIQIWSSVFQLRPCQSGKATLHILHMTLLPVFPWVTFVFTAVVWHSWLLLFTLQSLIVTQPVVPHPTFQWLVFILVQYISFYWTASILFFILLLYPSVKITENSTYNMLSATLTLASYENVMCILSPIPTVTSDDTVYIWVHSRALEVLMSCIAPIGLTNNHRKLPHECVFMSALAPILLHLH